MNELFSNTIFYSSYLIFTRIRIGMQFTKFLDRQEIPQLENFPLLQLFAFVDSIIQFDKSTHLGKYFSNS